MILYKNKYRIEPARLKNWDYGNNASYFVTICTQNREPYFGDIADGNIGLSEIGQYAQKYWEEIPVHFPFVVLGAFVIMPNHMHGIVIIDKPDGSGDRRDAINRVSTGGITGHHNPMIHQNLSRIIRWYKGRVTFESRKIHADFAWQSRFHDHIIRNEKSFVRIQDYIAANPKNWVRDKFYSQR